MPPFDRDSALKAAEKALRQGRIDVAIAEYLRIVEAQPRDWNSANQLGDLYVRANQIDKGVHQFTKIADHLAGEGFYPKAAALYKKILKIKPDDEHALMQSGDLATRQGLLADAKNFYRAVADRRKAKGDRRGAAEMSIRIGTLDPDDLEARLGAGRAAADIGDVVTAVREFKDVGFAYEKQSHPAEALAAFHAAYQLNPGDEDIRERLLAGYLASGDFVGARSVAAGAADLKRIAHALERGGQNDDVLDVLAQAAEHDPHDFEVRARLAQAYVAKGDLERARDYLTPDTAGDNPALWMTLAEIELSSGRVDEGRAAIARVLSLDPATRESVIVLGCRLAERSADAGYACIEAVVDTALAANEYAPAAAALHEFTTRVRDHVIALMRLVDICVDGGLDAEMYEAQAQLADAYLEVGRGLEARIISEDLVAREPLNRAHVDRFRRALVMLGEGDPDAIISERLSGDSPFLSGDTLDLNEGFVFDDEPAAPEPVAPPPPRTHASRPAPVETFDEVEEVEAVIDFDTPPEPQGPPPRSLDQVFQQKRDEFSRGSAEEAAAEQYRLALTYRDLGMEDEAIAALEEAARSPRQRFDAASLLGHLYLERENTAHAIDWFERAAEAPAPTQDAGRALLYDLAETLESVGEHARALAVFVELEAESGGFRDVARRIERLSKVQAKG